MDNASHFLKGEPEGLEEKKLKEYELIVAMKPRHKEMVVTKCPSCEGKTVVWKHRRPVLSPRKRNKNLPTNKKEGQRVGRDHLKPCM